MSNTGIDKDSSNWNAKNINPNDSKFQQQQQGDRKQTGYGAKDDAFNKDNLNRGGAKNDDKNLNEKSRNLPDKQQDKQQDTTSGTGKSGISKRA